MSCKDALAHPWMAAFDTEALATKCLSKEKMKRFLARQKWKVIGVNSMFLQPFNCPLLNHTLTRVL